MNRLGSERMTERERDTYIERDAERDKGVNKRLMNWKG